MVSTSDRHTSDKSRHTCALPPATNDQVRSFVSFLHITSEILRVACVFQYRRKRRDPLSSLSSRNITQLHGCWCVGVNQGNPQTSTVLRWRTMCALPMQNRLQKGNDFKRCCHCCCCCQTQMLLNDLLRVIYKHARFRKRRLRRRRRRRRLSLAAAAAAAVTPRVSGFACETHFQREFQFTHTHFPTHFSSVCLL